MNTNSFTLYSATLFRPLLFLFFFLAQSLSPAAQYDVRSDSWKDTKQKKHGSITALWHNIEPIIYKNAGGQIIGIEYELMEGFLPFLKKKYGIDVALKWVDARAFQNIYPYVRQSKQKGLFGLSFYSITPERQKEVKFSPPYMPDLNIIVTNNNLPAYNTDEDFIKDLARMKGFTMKQTTMEEDLMKLKSGYLASLPVSNQEDDYDVLKQISGHINAFGYVPVSIYVVALQRGIKIKRQRVLATRREGFGFIYPKESDWDEPVNEYFNSAEFKILVNRLMKKYLGEEVAAVILKMSSGDSLSGKPTDIELLTKEREIVTQRLIETALEVEHEKVVRNIALAAGTLVFVVAGISFNRFRARKKLNLELRQSNELIDTQKKQIEGMNEQLKMKMLQSRLNPHFLFNSLNSIQYFIGSNDRKGALVYLTRFASFLRNVLKYGDDLAISAEQESGLLEQYLWLEQCRFPGRFEYRIQIRGSETTSGALLPPMLVHSLVEDALYLGVLNLPENERGQLEIVMETIDKDLVVTVSDNGPDRNIALLFKQQKGLEPSNGAGDILRQRMELYNSKALKKIRLTHQLKEKSMLTVNEATLVIPQHLFN